MKKVFHSRRSLRFRQLSRKAYAAFVSLHREVTIGRVCRAVADLEMLKAGRHVAVVAMVCASQMALATESEAADPADLASEVLTESTTAVHQGDSVHRRLSLREVTVISNKAGIESSNYRLISSIGRTTIETLPIQTVSDVLQYMPGVDIRTRGVNGAQADVSMRGGTFDQVLVLINGVPISDAHTGHYSMNLPLSKSLIERIEVLQGTKVGLDGAFSGAINIITEQGRIDEEEQQEATLSLSAGMYGLVHPELSYKRQYKHWHMNASAEYSRAEGYNAPDASEKEHTAMSNSDYQLANVYMDMRWSETKWGDLKAMMAAQWKDAGAGMYYGFGSQDQFDATRTAIGTLSYDKKWGAFGLTAKAAYRANYDRYEWHRGQRKYGNFHFMQSTNATLEGHYMSRIGTTTLGVNIRHDNIHSTNLGDTINPLGQVPNVEGFELGDVRVLDLVIGDQRTNVLYYADQTFHYGDLSASLGVQGHYNTRFGHDVTGNANIGYQFATNGRVYLNAHRALRLPTFTDLYYNAGNQLGSRELKPEHAWTLSLGSRWTEETGRVGRITLEADAYYHWGRDIIDWVYVPEDTKRPYHATNQNRVNAAGVELGVRYCFFNDWIRSIGAQYAYTWLDLDLEKSGSRYLDYLSHKLVVDLDHAFWVSRHGTLGGHYTLRYQQREGQYNNAEGAVCDYRGVLLLDGSIYYETARMRASVDCTNITNRHYYDYGGLLQPGAWAKISVTCKL